MVVSPIYIKGDLEFRFTDMLVSFVALSPHALLSGVTGWVRVGIKSRAQVHFSATGSFFAEFRKIVVSLL